MIACVDALRDALSRVERASEGIEDGDLGFAAHVLADLGADLWSLIEQLEAGQAEGSAT